MCTRMSTPCRGKAGEGAPRARELSKRAGRCWRQRRQCGPARLHPKGGGRLHARERDQARRGPCKTCWQSGASWNAVSKRWPGRETQSGASIAPCCLSFGPTGAARKSDMHSSQQRLTTNTTAQRRRARTDVVRRQQHHCEAVDKVWSAVYSQWPLRNSHVMGRWRHSNRPGCVATPTHLTLQPFQLGLYLGLVTTTAQLVMCILRDDCVCIAIGRRWSAAGDGQGGEMWAYHPKRGYCPGSRAPTPKVGDTHPGSASARVVLSDRWTWAARVGLPTFRVCRDRKRQLFTLRRCGGTWRGYMAVALERETLGTEAAHFPPPVHCSRRISPEGPPTVSTILRWRQRVPTGRGHSVWWCRGGVCMCLHSR